MIIFWYQIIKYCIKNKCIFATEYKDIMQLFCTQTTINKLKNNKSPQFLLGALII